MPCNSKPVDMKKFLAILLSSTLILASCDNTRASQGAGTGAYLGAILGSAIGGISNGPRGSDVGTIVGMATGAVVGAAIGSASDRAEQEKYREYQERQQWQYERNRRNDNEAIRHYEESADSGFDPTNSGDDRIVFEKEDNHYNSYSTIEPKTYTPQSVSVGQLSKLMPGCKLNYNEDVEIRKASFVDYNGDGVLHANEEAKVTFEIMNNSSAVIYGVLPTVVETSGNKHIHISPSILVESIMPGKGVRYTATVRGDKKLKDGTAVIRVAVRQGQNDITSQIKEFTIRTSR